MRGAEPRRNAPKHSGQIRPMRSCVTKTNPAPLTEQKGKLRSQAAIRDGLRNGAQKTRQRKKCIADSRTRPFRKSRPTQRAKRSWTQGSGLRRTRQANHIPLHFGRTIRWLLRPREPKDIPPFPSIQGLLESRKAPGEVFLRDGLFIFTVCEEPLAIFQPRRTRWRIRQGGKKFPQQGQVAQRLAECILLPSQTALHQFSGEFRGGRCMM